MTKIIENNVSIEGNRLKLVFIKREGVKAVQCRLMASDGMFTFSTFLTGELPSESELSFESNGTALKLHALRVTVFALWKETGTVAGTKEKLRELTKGFIAGCLSDGTKEAKKFFIESQAESMSKADMIKFIMNGADLGRMMDFYYGIIIKEARMAEDLTSIAVKSKRKSIRPAKPASTFTNQRRSFIPHITFISRENNKILLKKEERTIYCRIFYAGKVREFSTGIKLLPDQFYNGTILIDSEVGAEYQRTLDLIKTEILSIYNNLRSAGDDISAEILQREYTNRATRKSKVEREGFVLNANLWIAIKQKLVGKDFGPKQLQRYCNRVEIFKRFIETELKEKEIPISSIRETTIHEFYVYMRGTLNHSKEYIRKTIQTIKSIIDYAVLNDVTPKNYIKNYSVKLDGNKAIKHLTLEQVQVLKAAKFADQTLVFVRDAFLFQCYTGMSYSEASRFSLQHIEQGEANDFWIRIERDKTGGCSVIPLFNEALELINKYKDLSHKTFGWFNNPGVIPFFDNATMNKILKQVGLVCNIPTALMCTHTGRKTFAMIMINRRGISMESVGQMLGHRETRTTNKYYASASVVRLKAEVQQTSFFNN